MISNVFLDTSFFKGFVDEMDEFHSKAVEVYSYLSSYKHKLVTTNFVLGETITLIRVKCGLEKVKDFQQALLDFEPLKLVRITGKDEKEAWKWFWNKWSKLSFTDCTSFAAMERLGLKRVATFDQHFGQAGFEVLGSN